MGLRVEGSVTPTQKHLPSFLPIHHDGVGCGRWGATITHLESKAAVPMMRLTVSVNWHMTYAFCRLIHRMEGGPEGGGKKPFRRQRAGGAQRKGFFLIKNLIGDSADRKALESAIDRGD
jgi:hypothetical protein